MNKNQFLTEMQCIKVNLVKNKRYKHKFSFESNQMNKFNCNKSGLMSQANLKYIVLIVLVGFTVSINGHDFQNKHCNHQHPKADDVSYFP